MNAFPKIGTAVLLLAGAVLTPTLAASQDREGRMKQRFERMDVNKDGKIGRDEFVGRVTTRFDSADANGDGELDVDEVVARMERRRMERRARRMLRRMDIDGDGKVTKAELERQAAKRFAVLDRNDDGVLEVREARRAREMRGGRKARREERRMRREHRRDHGRRGFDLDL